jgi:hypothetical protein
LRPHDYFVDEDDEYLDFDLLERLRLRPVAEYTDVEAALALAELMQQEFLRWVMPATVRPRITIDGIAQIGAAHHPA